MNLQDLLSKLPKPMFRYIDGIKDELRQQDLSDLKEGLALAMLFSVSETLPRPSYNYPVIVKADDDHGVVMKIWKHNKDDFYNCPMDTSWGQLAYRHLSGFTNSQWDNLKQLHALVDEMATLQMYKDKNIKAIDRLDLPKEDGENLTSRVSYGRYIKAFIECPNPVVEYALQIWFGDCYDSLYKELKKTH